VPGLILLAAVTPDNTPHGYNLTFLFPMCLFIVVAVILYLLFSRPHARIPARRALLAPGAGAPEPDAARAAAVAGGLSTAPGGGAAESAHEPAGAHLAAGPGARPGADPGPGPGADPGGDPGPGADPGPGRGPDPGGTAAPSASGAGTGSVSAEGDGPADAGQPGREAPTADGTEAGE
jgi:hypothetical protein